MPLSTHVLDLARGVPAADLAVDLVRVDDEIRTPLGSTVTDAGGRAAAPFAEPLERAVYELVFHAGAYFAHHDIISFYTDVPVRFRIENPAERYHVPLLLSPFGYSTYRGS